MTTTKHRIQYTELVGPQKSRYAEDVLISAVAPGNFRTVHEHLADVWTDGEIVVIEYVGSDASGRVVPETEWDNYSTEW